jgi:hypothetical protein
MLIRIPSSLAMSYKGTFKSWEFECIDLQARVRVQDGFGVGVGRSSGIVFLSCLGVCRFPFLERKTCNHATHATQ